MTAAELLRKAREIMNEGGRHWTQKTLVRVEEKMSVKRYCAIGGLNAAAGMPQVYMGSGDYHSDATLPDDYDGDEVIWGDIVNMPTFRARMDAQKILAEIIFGAPVDAKDAETIIYSFNDQARSWSEVAVVFEKAAEMAEARGL